MPAPNGYVGYTVTQQPVFRTCVAAYANPLHTPSITGQVNKAAALAGGFSLFEYVVTLNNLNGGKPVPPNNVIMARIDHQWSRLDPCNQPRQPTRLIYFEKFGNPVDVSMFFTGCKSVLCYLRNVQYAILPDPVAGMAIPQGENALSFKTDDAMKAAFAAAVTLEFDIRYLYDNCNNPPQTPTQTKHYLEFTARTKDPAATPPTTTWTLPGAPLVYSSN